MQRREEGRDRPKKMGDGLQRMIRDALDAALGCLVENGNHLTLAQSRDKLAEETGICVHPWTVGRELRRLQLTPRKKPLRAAQQDEAATVQARQNWRTALESIAPERLLFAAGIPLDESALFSSVLQRLRAASARTGAPTFTPTAALSLAPLG